MKTNHMLLLAFAVTQLFVRAHAQNVAINTDGSLPDSNAILDIKSANKGILIPRISSATRQSMTATKGLLVYDTTTNSFWFNNGTAWQNLSAGAGSWSLNGNSGTNSNNFIGTTDYQPFTIKVANTVAGRISIDSQIVSWGYYAGNANTTGYSNTTFGNFSLSKNTTGSGNTANGFFAMYNNTTGTDNTATGHDALYFNKTGSYNVAYGNASLMRSTTAKNNTAVGFSAMYTDTAGSYNTAIGTFSLGGNSEGHYNTAIGNRALISNGIGSNNTAIGAGADVGGYTLSNATALGAGAIANTSNKVRIGNSAVTVIEGQVPFTTPSDGRYKFNVKDDVPGLGFITQLRPVTYQFDVKRFEAQQANASINTNVLNTGYNEASMMRRSGFIAQEVEKAAMEAGYNFSGLITPKTSQDHYGLSYESFVVPLVKAVQELNKKVEEQNNKIAGLQSQLDALKQSQSVLK
jgi:trimeric autotransporter adhesin